MSVRKIFKYRVQMQDTFELKVPIDTEFLSVQKQHGEVELWALLDPAKESETRTFRLAGTGHEITNPDLSYIGTVQVMHDSLVWHLFEVL